MKIVFLDIDGVLNSEDFHRTRNISAFATYPLSDFDPTSIELLNQLATDDIKFVISSDRRHNHSLESLQAILKEVGFNGDIIDVTPSLTYRDRRVEIGMWVANSVLQDLDVETYCILDDETLDHRFAVEVDPIGGLTQEDIDRAKSILYGIH
jgi:hypothetical protein